MTKPTMIQRILFFLCIIVSQAAAQSLAMTSPTANQVISGTAFTLSATPTSLPTEYSREYDVDGEVACVTTTPPFSCVWNTYYTFNGAYHSIQAISRDATNATLATSFPPTAFSTANPLPIPTTTMNVAVTPSTVYTSNWIGTITFSFSVTGSNASDNKNIYIYVDGKIAVSDLTNPATSFTETLNTTQFNDGVRNVVIRVDDPTSGINMANANWITAFGMEKQVAFLNGGTPMELRADAQEKFLCTTPQTNCPTSATSTMRLYNTDETNSSVTPSSWASDNTAVTTVNSSGVITQVGVGSATITATCNAGCSGAGTFTRAVAVHVNTSNVMPHFLSDGTASTAYTTGTPHSIYASSVFNSNNSSFMSADHYPTAFTPCQDMLTAGFSAEFGLYWQNLTPSLPSESSWKASQDSYVQALQTQLGCGIPIHVIGDNAQRTNENMFLTTRSNAATVWNPTAYQYAVNSWKTNYTNGVIGQSAQDEVASNWGIVPEPPAAIGSGGFTQIACVNAANCTVSWTDWGLNGAFNFIITGSGDTNLDYNTSTNVLYTATSVDANTFTFPTPSGVGTHTYTAGSNPGLVLNAFVPWSYDASNKGLPPCSGETCGGSTPAVNWNRNNSFIQIRTWLRNVSGHMLQTWENAAGATGSASGLASIRNWNGDPTVSDYTEVFTSQALGGIQDYTPGLSNLYTLKTTETQQLRTVYANLGLNRLAPLGIKAEGINTSMGMQAYNVGITSISGSLVTFSGPHGITTVLPYNTRLQISGSSNSAYNTNFYVMDCPTPTTCDVALAASTVNLDINANNLSTATFHPSGDTVTLSNMNSVGATNYTGTYLTINVENSNCTSFNTYTHGHQGGTITVAGTSSTGGSIGAWGTTTFWWGPGYDSCGGAFSQIHMLQVPTGSATGGTAAINANESYTRGINYPGPGNSEHGQRYAFASYIHGFVLGASATRVYETQGYLDTPGTGQSPVTQFTTRWGDNDAANQTGLQPRFNYGNALIGWAAASNAVHVINGLLKFGLEQRISAPDPGQYFDCSARASSFGNLLMCLSLADGSITRDFNLSSYLQTGQPITRYICTWSDCTIASLAAGTTDDLLIGIPPGAFVAWKFSVNAAADYSPPTFSARLADVTNATAVWVQYAYNKALFTQPEVFTYALPNVANSTSAIPVDRQLGTVYYRLIYVDTNGKVLSVGDVQQL